MIARPVICVRIAGVSGVDSPVFVGRRDVDDRYLQMVNFKALYLSGFF
jgi:hypothetical protein